MMDEQTKIYVNPTGRFVIGGPMGDTGLTGRKDHRRYLRRLFPPRRRRFLRAKTRPRWTAAPRLCGTLYCKECRRSRTCQRSARCRLPMPSAWHSRSRSWWIPSAPASIADDKLSDIVCHAVDLRPAAIIKKFDLRRPIYKQIAAYGHMGREDLGMPWEKTDLADTLKAAAKQ